MNKNLKHNLEEIRFRFEDEKDYENFSDYKIKIIKLLNHYKLKNVRVARNIYDDFIITFTNRGIKTIWRVSLNGISTQAILN